MNYKIKIGQPHIYFRMKRFYKKHFVNAENFLILLLTLITIGIAFNAFLKADLTTKFAITTICFMGTTVFLLMKKSSKVVQNERD